MSYFLLLSGFALLIGAGDLLVRGATSMALRLGIPAMIVGLTIVAFGTSAPELMVAMRAAIGGAPGIAIGNVVGSNIANILIVLGLPALFYTSDCNAPQVRRNTVFMIGATILFIVLCFLGPLRFWHGALLFSLIVIFLIMSGRSASRQMAIHRAGQTDEDGDSDHPEFKKTRTRSESWPFIVGFILVGLAGLPFGAEMVVDGASGIARGFGISEAAIGLTLVALGTSLPELTTTLVAVLRRHGGIAIGNVIGSNLFNLLAVMGLTAMVAPVAVPEQLLEVDLWVMLATSVIIIPMAFFSIPITRAPAAALVLTYVGYIIFVLSSAETHTSTIAAPVSVASQP